MVIPEESELRKESDEDSGLASQTPTKPENDSEDPKPYFRAPYSEHSGERAMLDYIHGAHIRKNQNQPANPGYNFTPFAAQIHGAVARLPQGSTARTNATRLEKRLYSRCAPIEQAPQEPIQSGLLVSVPLDLTKNANPSRSGQAGAEGVGPSLVTAPPPPPPCPPPAQPVPAGQRCLAVGPTGLESPASSNTTEILSDTVKGPFEEGLNLDLTTEERGESENWMKNATNEEMNDLLNDGDKIMDEANPQASNANLDTTMAGEEEEGSGSGPGTVAIPVLHIPDDAFSGGDKVRGQSRMPEMVGVVGTSQPQHPSAFLSSNMAILTPTVAPPQTAPPQDSRPPTARFGFDPYAPPPPSQPQMPAPIIQVAESVAAEKRISTVITDPATG